MKFHACSMRAAWCAALLAFVLALVACGGGGSSAPPPPTLQVASSASAVHAGGDNVTLTATTTGTTEAVAWTLTGPGALTAASGGQVSYAPPRPSQLSVATTATITAKVGAVEKSVQITLQVAAGGTWEAVSLPRPDFLNADFVNGRFYALGANTLLTSTDAVSWEAAATPPATRFSDVGHGDAGWVGTSWGGDIFYSADGLTWSRGSVVASDDATSMPPSALQLSTIAFGNGVYVGTGVQGVVTSTDGIHWVCRTGPLANWLAIDARQLAFGIGRFVAVGYGGSFTSTDGVNWTTLKGLPTLYGVAYGNGLFVARDTTGSWTSVDGLAWTPGGDMSGAGDPTYFGKLAFGDGRFYAFADVGAEVSSDGVHWSQIYKVDASSGLEIQGVAAGAGHVAIVGYHGFIQQTSDGTNWSTPDVGAGLPFNGVDCMNGICVALDGNEGSVLTSSDLKNWTRVPLTTQPAFSAITHGNGLFLVAGWGEVFTSPEGKTWTRSSPNESNHLQAAAYGAGHFVVVGQNDAVYTSTDGTSWSAAPSGIPPTPGSDPSLVELAYGGGRFVTIDRVGNVFASADGVSWAVGATGAPVGQIAYGASAGFVAVGFNGSVWHSTDATTWTAVAPFGDGPSQGLYALGYGDSRFVAAGGYGTILVSEDGIHWDSRGLSMQSGYTGVAFTGEAFVVVGIDGAVALSFD
jgi:hypothetical protein